MDERENKTLSVGEGLAASLARMRAARDQRTPEEIAADNHPLPSLHVQSKPLSTRPRISRAELARLLGPLEVIFGSRALSDDEMEMKYRVYFDVLGNLSEREARVAVERYLRKTDPPNQFFPKPGELLALSKV